MKQQPFKSMLRNAVIAAIPLATQVGCAATETKPDGNVTTAPIPQSTDPCRTGETTRKSDQQQYTVWVKRVPEPVSAEQCIALCKQEFEKARVGGMFNDLIKLERIEASNCKTESVAFRSAFPARGRINEPSTKISCDVDYTALHSPFTCPRPVVGRIPNGMHLAADTQMDVVPNTLGEYLADMAAMETAAITAFQYLSRELEAYDAPAELIARARLAVAEESRHAEMAGLLSAAYDAEVPAVNVDDFVLRSLYEIALENAVEGCVNETFAAACGLWQSEHAQLDVFREVIAHISDEETGHAALSWDIHAWVMPQLTEAQRTQITVAQTEALDKLMADFKQEGNPVLQRAFGLPTRDDAARLFTQLQETVWGVLVAPSIRDASATA